MLKIFLLIPILFANATWDTFNFHTNLTCTVRDVASYSIQFIELDGWPNPNDDVTKVFSMEMTNGKSQQEFTGGLDGDASSEYVIRVHITHNCTTDGAEKSSQTKLLKKFDTDTNHDVYLQIHLANLEGTVAVTKLYSSNAGLTEIIG